MKLKRPGPRALIVLAGAAVLLVSAACTLLTRNEELASVINTATPYVVYVTATPEGFQAPVTPSETPYVVYVTPTADLNVTPTPFIVYVTATPQFFGPHNLDSTTEPTSGPAPTLDLSGATLIPTPNPEVASRPTNTPNPAATSVPPTATPIPSPTPTPVPTAQPIRIQSQSGGQYSSHLGIDFISGGDHENDAARYQLAIETGAGWNRYPLVSMIRPTG